MAGGCEVARTTRGAMCRGNVVAALLITAGRLGDLRGPRKLSVAGIAVFTLASAA